MSAISDEIRRSSGEGDKKRDAGLKTPADVVRFDDIVYGQDAKWQVLDVYRPKKYPVNEKLPVIVSFHGGGWMYGDKEVYQFYGMSLAQRGFAVINFTYRLAPEVKWPAAILDMNAVMNWMLDHADEYGFDTGRLFAVGDSAGGHMLTVYSTIQTSPEFAALFDMTPADVDLKGVALNCGVYRILEDTEGGKNLPAKRLVDMMEDILPGSDRAKEFRQINPIPYMTEAFPKAYVMTANADSVIPVDQKDILKAAFDRKNISYMAKEYGSEESPLDHVFHCNMRLAEAKECNDDECAFFRSICDAE